MAHGSESCHHPHQSSWFQLTSRKKKKKRNLFSHDPGSTRGLGVLTHMFTFCLGSQEGEGGFGEDVLAFSKAHWSLEKKFIMMHSLTLTFTLTHFDIGFSVNSIPRSKKGDGTER